MSIFTNRAVFFGRVKIQMTSRSVLRYYILKCLIEYLLSNVSFSQTSDLPSYLLLNLSRGLDDTTTVQILSDISTRFALYFRSFVLSSPVTIIDMDNKTRYFRKSGPKELDS